MEERLSVFSFSELSSVPVTLRYPDDKVRELALANLRRTSRARERPVLRESVLGASVMVSVVRVYSVGVNESEPAVRVY